MKVYQGGIALRRKVFSLYARSRFFFKTQVSRTVACFLAIGLVSLLFLVVGRAQVSAQEGTAARCDNYAATPAAHRCHCGRAEHSDCSQPTPRVEMDKSCATYCVAQNCRCLSKCTTH